MKKNVFIFILSLFACTHEITPGQIAAGPQPVDPNAVVTGKVTLKEGLSPRGTGTLFLIARPKGIEGGPPLAVKRVEDPVFPVSFRMSQANVMIQGNRFAGEIALSAKWSKEGSPMASSPGDLTLSEPLDIKVGDLDVEIVLDQEIR
jgi:cytochrome c-type biogenesis protein CcmH